MSQSTDPRNEYQTRLDARKASVAELQAKDASIGTARLLTAVAAIGGYFLLTNAELSLVWLAVPVLVFFVLVALHGRVRKLLCRQKTSVRYYERCLERLDGRWAGTGNQGAAFVDSEHPYAADLDLFGKGSLFELLCTAQTQVGEQTLASWLLNPASPEEIAARQAAIEELRGRLDLREELMLLGGDVRENVPAQKLAAWGAAERAMPGRQWQIIAALLTVFMLVATFLWWFTDVGRAPFLIGTFFVLIVWRVLRDPVRQVNQGVSKHYKELEILARVLERLEREPCSSAKLSSLKAALVQDTRPASAQIHELLKRVRLLDAENNQFFAIPAFFLLWSTHFAFLFETWRERSGAAIGKWLAAVGEMEALCALAAYAYEHPADPFPEITGELIYDGSQLGHPLLNEKQCVRNDVRLDENLRILIVSGSNMSGKSTLLRTVGTNAVLALAGAPVRAEKLRLCPVTLGATLRIQDSLQAGRSRFYAEIARLRQLVDLTGGKRPLLFLLDEILHGTNSHDRRIGAEQILNGLVSKGAFGLVTTHDLALAEAAGALGRRAANVHFADEMKDGQLIFDYTMRPGVVKKSNALELMRAVGLPVVDTEATSQK
ncbi:MAG TPA: DNA mismatch repair protein MutS [Planctomycetota bacterium]|nr:DNA mismatch repair protein MutS [Planctomycetota bacterium]